MPSLSRGAVALRLPGRLSRRTGRRHRWTRSAIFGFRRGIPRARQPDRTSWAVLRNAPHRTKRRRTPEVEIGGSDAPTPTEKQGKRRDGRSSAPRLFRPAGECQNSWNPPSACENAPAPRTPPMEAKGVQSGSRRQTQRAWTPARVFSRTARRPASCVSQRGRRFMNLVEKLPRKLRRDGLGSFERLGPGEGGDRSPAIFAETS